MPNTIYTLQTSTIMNDIANYDITSIKFVSHNHIGQRRV